MKVFVVRDSAFTLKNGQPASDVLGYDAFSRRYLQEFSEVVLVGRLFKRELASTAIATGAGVSFIELPGYHGPVGFFRALPRILRVCLRLIEPGSAYILRIPATIPSLLSIALRLRGIPFGVEVAMDPRDGYSRRALGGTRFAGLFQACFVFLTRWQCRVAAATGYVTREALQRRYPPGNPANSFAFTSIDLTPGAFVEGPRPATSFAHTRERTHIVLVGNMQKSVKGHDVLLNAMALLKAKGLNLHLTVVGHGENQPTYASMAEKLGLEVIFLGRLLNGDPVRNVLDTADIFVLPSRQEGLPRALLEAMARGLPAVATRVGGTPELLPEACLAPPDDPPALAERIAAALESPEHLANLSSANLAAAKQYDVQTVTRERVAFYKAIKTAVAHQEHGL